MCGKKITGLVSWGVDTCGSHMPGVYVNVAFFRNWIDKVRTLIHICFLFYLICCSNITGFEEKETLIKST